MSRRGEVLVAILNNKLDLNLALDQHWYRIPVSGVERFIKTRWPPEWLAFYQTKVFGPDAYAVNYIAQVSSVETVSRHQLFPDEGDSIKSQRRYYRLRLEAPQRLQRPITSRTWRRIVFIPTTLAKFRQALEINDLFDESPLEDRLWAEMKRLQIPAERQLLVQIKGRFYLLDFDIYCDRGRIDVETDGDSYHANPAKAADDNLRNNDLESSGWKVLRYTTAQIQEQMADYCLPNIVRTIENLGGLDESGLLPRKIDLAAPEGSRQLSLFEGP